MGGGLPEIPDYKVYNNWQKVPQLQEINKELAKHGLKDHWIRNEVWRFQTRSGKPTTTLRTFMRGFFGWPFLAAIPIGYGLSVLVDKYWTYPVDPTLHQHHDDHH